MIEKKVTLKDYANFIVNQFHKGKHFEFEVIAHSICLTLKIIGPNEVISHYYFICPTGYLVAETSNPFYPELMKYYKDIDTMPAYNFYFVYLQVDNDLLPVKAQLFKIADNSPLLSELL